MRKTLEVNQIISDMIDGKSLILSKKEWKGLRIIQTNEIIFISKYRVICFKEVLDTKLFTENFKVLFEELTGEGRTNRIKEYVTAFIKYADRKGYSVEVA